MVGRSGVILTSPDGIDFTKQDSGTDRRLDGVAFGNDLFVVVGRKEKILNSTDGIDWY